MYFKLLKYSTFKSYIQLQLYLHIYIKEEQLKNKIEIIQVL